MVVGETFSETVGDNFHFRMIDNSVVGFIDPAFSGPEQGPGHSVPSSLSCFTIMYATD